MTAGTFYTKIRTPSVLTELRAEEDSLGTALRQTSQRLLQPAGWVETAGSQALDFVVLVDTLDPGYRKLLDGQIRLGDGRLPVRFQVFDFDIPDFQSLGLSASVADLAGSYLISNGPTQFDDSVIAKALQQLLAIRRIEVSSVDFSGT